MALNNFQISKILTEYDVQENVGLPAQTVEHMNPVMNGEHSVDLIVFDRWQQRWPLKYYTRPNGDRRTPIFTTGWRQFVAANGVLPGDELIFSRRQDAGEMQYYMIQVKRRTNTREGGTVDVEVIKTVQGEPVIYW